MKDIPTASPLPNTPPTQDFSKLGVVYITLLGLANQVMPHTGSWRPLATALNYLVHIAPIVYMAFQARPASPAGVQPDSGMGRDSIGERTYLPLTVSFWGRCVLCGQEGRYLTSGHRLPSPKQSCHQELLSTTTD
ncbi:hypothetical protein DSO57_1035556 [Entomophthora muscae]|uniref:Uncharacterized protein n=1 Tax=Entomophthora muscae TaxID=34485 RepID=A0ACC2U950_9FUNG|nr:hypothetical protein DSO57_1035556 [Entomophthora muscae]